MNSGRFDCEIFQEADGSTAIYSIMYGLESLEYDGNLVFRRWIHIESKVFYMMPFKIRFRIFILGIMAFFNITKYYIHKRGTHEQFREKSSNFPG